MYLAATEISTKIESVVVDKCGKKTFKYFSSLKLMKMRQPMLKKKKKKNGEFQC